MFELLIISSTEDDIIVSVSDLDMLELDKDNFDKLLITKSLEL